MNTKSKIYVTMTDKRRSGLGCYDFKAYKIVIVCENQKQADTVAERMRRRKDIAHVIIRNNVPEYPYQLYKSEKIKYEDLYERRRA